MKRKQQNQDTANVTLQNLMIELRQAQSNGDKETAQLLEKRFSLISKSIEALSPKELTLIGDLTVEVETIDAQIKKKLSCLY